MRVLVVENDPVTAKLLHHAMEAEWIMCEPAETGEDALDLAKHYAFSVIVIGHHLPDMDGVEIARSLRAAKIKTPILFLLGTQAGHNTAPDLIAEGDDYITSPFHNSEITERIHALFCRSTGHLDGIIKTGELEINLASRSVNVRGRRLHITRKEYGIIELLSLRKGETTSEEMLLDHLYGGIDEPDIIIIDVLVAKLRRKMAVATNGSHYIEMIESKGYVLREPVAHQRKHDHQRNARSNFDSTAESQWPEQIDDSITPLATADTLERLAEVIELLDRSLIENKSVAGVFSKSEIPRIKETKENLFVLLLVCESSRFIEEEMIEKKIDQVNDASAMMQRLLLSKKEELQEHRLQHSALGTVSKEDSNHITEDAPRRHEPASWISGQDFKADTFNMMADFAKCLHYSSRLHQKILCNVVFLIEITRALASVAAELVPFAGSR